MKEESIVSLDELEVIAFVNRQEGKVQCLSKDLEVQGRLREALLNVYPETQFQAVSEDIKHESDVMVFAVAENSICLFPYSRKPEGWSWGRFAEVAKVSKLMICTNPKTEFDSVHIYRG